MSSYEVRRGRASDGPAVRRILAAILDEHGLKPVDESPDLEIVDYGASDPSKDRFVAVFEGTVIGFATVAALADGAAGSASMGELSHLFVERAHRRHGVASLLVARAVDAAKARGYVSLHLSTMKAFASACSYYERHGWIREPDDSAGTIFFTLRLADAPQVDHAAAPLLPPMPWLLQAVLALLAWFARTRERLESELGSPGMDRSGPPLRSGRHPRSR